MLWKIPLLTSLLFAAIYPLCFWISYKNPLTNKFHKFHLGLPNFVGGVVVVFILFMPGVPLYLKISALIWKALLLGISNYYWKRETANPFFISIPCVFGLVVFVFLLGELILAPLLQQKIIAVSYIPVINAMSILSGFVFCLSLFSMKNILLEPFSPMLIVGICYLVTIFYKSLKIFLENRVFSYKPFQLFASAFLIYVDLKF